MTTSSGVTPTTVRVKWHSRGHKPNQPHLWLSVILILATAAPLAGACPNPRRVPALVAETAVGETVPFTGVRHVETRPLSVTTAETPESGTQPRVRRAGGDWGLEVSDITPDLVQQLDLVRTTGVVVTAVAPRTPAEDAGVRAGDVIMEVTRRPVRNVSGYQRAIGAASSEHALLLLIERHGQTLLIALSGSG